MNIYIYVYILYIVKLCHFVFLDPIIICKPINLKVTPLGKYD